MSHVRHPIGGDPPELGVEELERDVAVVAGSRQPFDDRRERQVAVAGEDAVGVAGQLARHAADVGELHPGDYPRGQLVEVLELAGPGLEME